MQDSSDQSKTDTVSTILIHDVNYSSALLRINTVGDGTTDRMRWSNKGTCRTCRSDTYFVLESCHLSHPDALTIIIPSTNVSRKEYRVFNSMEEP
eukprot:scaffold5694_cov87-Cylindrotheca_fusiformis.AAC.2